MRHWPTTPTRAAIILGTTVGLPLVGAYAAGRKLRALLQFPPPLAIPTDYPRFSWVAVALVLAPFFALSVAATLAARSGQTNQNTRAVAAPQPCSVRHRLPIWGWTALGWTIAWWILAWTRFAWFATVQPYTFFPLWLGFIILANAVAVARAGTCQLTRAPIRWVALFAASGAFWWIFEWLNRFSRNWHYLGVASFGPTAYAVNGTLCFSTVLPAVASVAELLLGMQRFQAACANGPPLRWLNTRTTGVLLIVGGVVALVGTGMAPMRFYAALWAAPLALLVGDAILARRDELPSQVATGDWRRAATWAVATVICGVFWEMWNFHSAAKWIYTVPYVDRWHVFEMPLLGYTGYLPFGLECYFVASRVLGADSPFSNASST